MSKACCEQCSYFVYDEQDEEYYCTVNLDEDEMYQFMSQSKDSCKFFNLYDEYKLVRKQN